MRISELPAIEYSTPVGLAHPPRPETSSLIGPAGPADIPPPAVFPRFINCIKQELCFHDQYELSAFVPARFPCSGSARRYGHDRKWPFPRTVAGTHAPAGADHFG